MRTEIVWRGIVHSLCDLQFWARIFYVCSCCLYRLICSFAGFLMPLPWDLAAPSTVSAVCCSFPFPARASSWTVPDVARYRYLAVPFCPACPGSSRPLVFLAVSTCRHLCFVNPASNSQTIRCCLFFLICSSLFFPAISSLSLFRCSSLAFFNCFSLCLFPCPSASCLFRICSLRLKV